MNLYSYIVTRDYGFAPNPFTSYCTLATCKPILRRNACIGDWVVGIGSASKNSPFKNKVIYAMKVSEKMSFDDYWDDLRFIKKRPKMNGSKRQMYGDNIYHRTNINSPFVQEDSHHSLPHGETNTLNYNRDLTGKFVLVSKDFWYFGEEAIQIPEKFISIAKVIRGYKKTNSENFINEFSDWLNQFPQKGYIGKPYMFNKVFTRYSGN